jgi:DNA processing protein
MDSLEEKTLWLRLALSKKIGPITFWKILQKSENDIYRACKSVENLAPEDLAAKELFLHKKYGFSILTPKDPSFPKTLLNLKDCPPFLSVVGNLNLLNRPTIAIVGARNASLAGKNFAAKFAKTLGQSGFSIVSGMARGIDGAAHYGSIGTGSIAVLAGGLDVIYPPENTAIYESLKKQGVIVSEMPLGTVVDSTLFPRRNRIIAGLSNGVVLIEAAEQSGSLITARFALENNIEIFAVPGSPFDSRSRGCNNLIKQGAILVDSVDDVLSCMGVAANKVEPIFHQSNNCRDRCSPAGQSSELKESILDEVSHTPISIDSLFQTQNCSLPRLLTLLTELEHDGKILRHANSHISLAYTTQVGD